MTALVWDATGSRFYEAGVDRCVLYPGNNTVIPVAWNGVVSIADDRSEGTSTPYYLDGVKYLDTPVPTDFAATLAAVSYPVEFYPYDGVIDTGGGIYAPDQMPQTFGLSYRSLIGNDIDGTDYGYNLHLLWNLTATPTTKTYATLDDSPAAAPFTWSLVGVPVTGQGIRPTCQLIISSLEIDPTVLANLESMLYGDTDTDPILPAMSDVLALV